ncbi:hypothetical protein H375_5470 [Rickettsia prowazekii str. Breinl]|nr:hypothetical protein H374_730 [Rickettsia prowazekii str. NMRC Madrid E]AGJ02772.1 hypothetical protein H375_5470 [Rickettsia prowazekii str. Breinl]
MNIFLQECKIGLVYIMGMKSIKFLQLNSSTKKRARTKI